MRIPSGFPAGLMIGLCGLAAVALAHEDHTDSRSQAVRQSIRNPGSTSYASAVQPLIRKYCVTCHSTSTHKAGLDLQQFTGPANMRKDLKSWQGVIDHLSVGDMPPRSMPQPNGSEKSRIIAWVGGFLTTEARATAGDPGEVLLRRLSNTEYNCSIRDLTGVDLQPTREFPADGAAGEGFTNSAESLSDISPTLLSKYFAAAKDISEHAVLLPDGIRFAPGKSRREWTDESTAQLRSFYAAWTGPDGKLNYTPYLSAAVRYRSELTLGKVSINTVAAQEKLNGKYLGFLWKCLTDPGLGSPLAEIQTKWKTVSEARVADVAAEIGAWQNRLWQTARVGSYVRPVGQGFIESLSRQVPNNPDADKAHAAGFDRFRECFPLYLCYPNVIPIDEVVNLKMFHREDEPLERLFLNAGECKRLDRLWEEHLFISRQPAAENRYLPLFIGFVTQDQPKEMVTFFEGQRPAFQKRADAFEHEEEVAIPMQKAALAEFTSRAYRRPLTARETAEQLTLYSSLRSKGATHEEAFRGVISRVLVSPEFLFRMEQPAAANKAAPISDWELATRLSYFLWSSTPDAELRKLAASGRLRNPLVLREQTRRMLKDEKVRSLAVEFGAQWLHVRGFDALNDKNERIFPTFDESLRRAIYEETILFFQGLFQQDRPAADILSADYTYLNGQLAMHYGIPGVTGPQWRRVDNVRQYGRGGVLGLASVQASVSGASRTSPVLRGNWVVETLLGEKMPRPPPNVPKLPEEEGAGSRTVREEVEQHSKNPACAVCHQRMDPYGFALERYDAIGRRRVKDLGGLAIDDKAILKDGTRFEGIDGLRGYLMTTRKNQVMHLFCRRLLGYALGRSVTNSDQPLIDEMAVELNKNRGIDEVVEMIISSAQFRMIRGRVK